MKTPSHLRVGFLLLCEVDQLYPQGGELIPTTLYVHGHLSPFNAEIPRQFQELGNQAIKLKLTYTQPKMHHIYTCINDR